MRCAAQEYRFGFFLMMDLVGTASLLLDIKFLTDAIGFNR